MEPQNKSKISTMWVGWTFSYFLNFVAFFIAGSKAKNKKWTLFGWIYLIMTITTGLFSTEISVFSEKPLAAP